MNPCRSLLIASLLAISPGYAEADDKEKPEVYYYKFRTIGIEHYVSSVPGVLNRETYINRSFVLNDNSIYRKYKKLKVRKGEYPYQQTFYFESIRPDVTREEIEALVCTKSSYQMGIFRKIDKIEFDETYSQYSAPYRRGGETGWKLAWPYPDKEVSRKYP